MEEQFLLDKKGLAPRLHLKVRGVESLMKHRKIPFFKLSNKIILFSWPAVEKALAAYEVKAIGIGNGKRGRARTDPKAIVAKGNEDENEAP
jgi:hypothetical protein